MIQQNIAHTTGTDFNCAFHSFAHLLLAMPTKSIVTNSNLFPIYNKIMHTFYEYHQVPAHQQVNFEIFISLMKSKIVDPFSREILWGPVLRKVLQDMLPAGALPDGTFAENDQLSLLAARMGLKLTMHSRHGTEELGNVDPLDPEDHIEMVNLGNSHYEFYFNSADAVQKTADHNLELLVSRIYIILFPDIPNFQKLELPAKIRKCFAEARQKGAPAPEASPDFYYADLFPEALQSVGEKMAEETLKEAERQIERQLAAVLLESSRPAVTTAYSNCGTATSAAQPEIAPPVLKRTPTFG